MDENKKNNDNYENLFSTAADDIDASVSEENADVAEAECPVTEYSDDTADADNATDPEVLDDDDDEEDEYDEEDAELEARILGVEKKDKPKNTVTNTILIILGLAVIIGCIVFFALSGKDGQTQDGDGTGTSATTTDPSQNTTVQNFIPGGDENADVKSVYTENFAFTNAEISYAVMSSYQNLIYNYQYYGGASALGIDTTKSLKEQPCSFMAEGKTWFDYFLESTLETVNEVLSICEAAKAAGFEMPDDVKTSIDSALDSFESSATQAGMTVEEYFRQNLGEVVTPDVLRSLLEKSYYAQAYINYCVEQIDVSDAALEAAYDADPNTADTVDFVIFYLDPQSLISDSKDSSAETDTSAETETSADSEDDAQAKLDIAMNKCRVEATEIAKAETKDDLIAAAKNTFSKVFKLEDSDIDTLVQSAEYTDQAYAGDVVTKKIFSLKDGETFVVEDETDGVVYVGMLIKRNGRDESSATRDVRHILFKRDTYGDDTKAKEVYDKWVTDGAKLEDFITLAAEYSEDPGSAKNGGLYEGVAPGEMVDEFNDWLFDSERVVGDHAIVETANFGWHIMYFEADGEPAWKAAVKTSLQNAESERVATSATETYKPTVDEAVLETVPA
ncbi:MAG: peptidylprolyl isomerase [Clostridia bacterium]|nr:peptidylprolyl isomerase [Clostridia bacterium]